MVDNCADKRYGGKRRDEKKKRDNHRHPAINPAPLKRKEERKAPHSLLEKRSKTKQQEREREIQKPNTTREEPREQGISNGVTGEQEPSWSRQSTDELEQ